MVDRNSVHLQVQPYSGPLRKHDSFGYAFSCLPINALTQFPMTVLICAPCGTSVYIPLVCILVFFTQVNDVG